VRSPLTLNKIVDRFPAPANPLSIPPAACNLTIAKPQAAGKPPSSRNRTSFSACGRKFRLLALVRTPGHSSQA